MVKCTVTSNVGLSLKLAVKHFNAKSVNVNSNCIQSLVDGVLFSKNSVKTVVVISALQYNVTIGVGNHKFSRSLK